MDITRAGSLRLKSSGSAVDEEREKKDEKSGEKDKIEERKELHTGGRSFYLFIFIRDTGAAWRVAPTVSEHLQPPESCPPPA